MASANYARYHAAEQPASLPSEGEKVPDSAIPAAGRGNSEDGHNWLNPSPNQLFRALARKQKPIEAEDADAVASVHEMVTNATWAGILEYEELHKDKCPNPTLARFQGMYGKHTIKSKLVHLVGGSSSLPFDRHDWFVDRCGKEVRYIIDYYSFEEPDPEGGPPLPGYSIDTRPAPTLEGMYDRLRVAYRRYRRGEQVW